MICQCDNSSFLFILFLQQFVDFRVHGCDIYIISPILRSNCSLFSFFDDVIIDSSAASYVEAWLIWIHLKRSIWWELKFLSRTCLLFATRNHTAAPAYFPCHDTKNNIIGSFLWTVTSTLLKILSVTLMKSVLNLFLGQSQSNWDSRNPGERNQTLRRRHHVKHNITFKCCYLWVL